MSVHPVQPLERDKEGVVRFKQNKIVRFMFDAGRNGWKFDLNTLAEMEFENEDRVQLMQLIGYSLCGYGELSFVSDDDYNAAEKLAQKL